MDIRNLIFSTIREKGATTVAEITKKTDFSRAYIHRFFQVLVEEGLIVKIGQTNRTRYVLPDKKALRTAKLGIQSFNRSFSVKGLQEDRVFDLIKSETGILESVPENISRIFEYAFTEMLNNAIEHSRSEKVNVTAKRSNGLIRFEVVDWGIGIFENLIHTRHLISTEEAIQDLLKGKQTTAPEEHSGEGIFFTRRAADTFIIKGSNKKLFFNNKENDFAVLSIKPIYGTRVAFIIAEDSRKDISDIFKKYSNEEYEFATTEVAVRLYQPGGASDFISRSQARRILLGLDKFKKVILDFKGVRAVGQGFVDEIFRVWKNKNPETEILSVGANEDIEFMIRRGK